ncbi:MAG TPA: protein-L-isoaspartate O-methyltransferase [Alphaproteobacteria bacterium]|nr:protein-L-isoaspartate O-methyltransferase [Alphaproteobacteria bacterium]|tara:strand:+ start:338 stop:988 length:651 start_codon:yes stop_codon:yes gene_type:complete
MVSDTTDEYLPQKARLVMTLRAQAVMSPNILSAIEQTPREKFVPDHLKAHAYENASLPIGNGQTISQPYIVAKMTEYLELNKRHRVLEIGTGSGYQAAILACLVRRVYTMERLRPLMVQAEARCKQLQLSNITYRHADGNKGWPEAAPFDRIIITCQTEHIPAALLDQLKVGGILVAPVGPSGQEELFRVKRGEDGFETDCLMPVRFVPMIDGTDS